MKQPAVGFFRKGRFSCKTFKCNTGKEFNLQELLTLLFRRIFCTHRIFHYRCNPAAMLENRYRSCVGVCSNKPEGICTFVSVFASLCISHTIVVVYNQLFRLLSLIYNRPVELRAFRRFAFILFCWYLWSRLNRFALKFRSARLVLCATWRDISRGLNSFPIQIIRKNSSAYSSLL